MTNRSSGSFLPCRRVAATGVALIFLGSAEAAFFSSSDRGRRGPALLKMEPGVRAMGLGGAAVSLVEGAEALPWNPAGLQGALRPEIRAEYARLFEDQSQQHIGFAFPAWRRGERETWGLSVSRLSIDGFDLMNNGTPVGQARPWEGSLGVSYARPARNFSLGITGKWVASDVSGEEGHTGVFDLGLRGGDDSSNWGLVLANAGPPMTLGNGRVYPPLVIRAGASRGVSLGKFGRLAVAGQLDAPADDMTLARLGMEHTMRGKAGVFAFRLGARSRGTNRLTAGLGIGQESMGIDYAYAPSESVGASHRIEFTWRFATPLALEEKRRRLFQDAQAAWDKGRAVQAAGFLEEIRGFSPRYYPALRLAREVNQRIEESLKPETLFTLGIHAYDEKDFDRAVNYFQKLILCRPPYPDAETWLAKAESSLKEEKENRAREEFKRAREWVLKGRIDRLRESLLQKKWEESLEESRNILTLEPSNAEALTGLSISREKMFDVALAAESAGNREHALALYRALAEAPPYRDSARRFQMLDQAVQAERAEQAIGYYRNGVQAYDNGDLDGAVRQFEKALALSPNNSTIAKALERVNAEKDRAK